MYKYLFPFTFSSHNIIVPCHKIKENYTLGRLFPLSTFIQSWKSCWICCVFASVQWNEPENVFIELQLKNNCTEKPFTILLPTKNIFQWVSIPWYASMYLMMQIKVISLFYLISIVFFVNSCLEKNYLCECACFQILLS